MKLKLNLVSIGAIITFILSIVMLGLFISANTTSQGYFETQFDATSYVIAFCILACALSIAVIGLPMITVPEKNKKIIKLLVDLFVIAISVSICLSIVYVAKASAYEIAITLGSELHKNEPFMMTACTNAMASIGCGLAGVVILSILACIPVNKVFGK